MTDPTEAIRKAHAAFLAFPSGQTIDALTAACTPSTIRALLDRLDSAERERDLLNAQLALLTNPNRAAKQSQ